MNYHVSVQLGYMSKDFQEVTKTSNFSGLDVECSSDVLLKQYIDNCKKLDGGKDKQQYNKVSSVTTRFCNKFSKVCHEI